MPRLTRLAIPWTELPFLTVGEVAEVLGVHRSVVDEMVKAGTLTLRQIGDQRRVETASVVAWLDGVPVREVGARAPRPSPAVRRAAMGLGIRGVR